MAIGRINTVLDLSFSCPLKVPLSVNQQRSAAGKMQAS